MTHTRAASVSLTKADVENALTSYGKKTKLIRWAFPVKSITKLKDLIKPFPQNDLSDEQLLQVIECLIEAKAGGDGSLLVIQTLKDKLKLKLSVISQIKLMKKHELYSPCSVRILIELESDDNRYDFLKRINDLNQESKKRKLNKSNWFNPIVLTALRDNLNDGWGPISFTTLIKDLNSLGLLSNTTLIKNLLNNISHLYHSDLRRKFEYKKIFSDIKELISLVNSLNRPKDYLQTCMHFYCRHLHLFIINPHFLDKLHLDENTKTTDINRLSQVLMHHYANHSVEDEPDYFIQKYLPQLLNSKNIEALQKAQLRMAKAKSPISILNLIEMTFEFLSENNLGLVCEAICAIQSDKDIPQNTQSMLKIIKKVSGISTELDEMQTPLSSLDQLFSHSYIMTDLPSYTDFMRSSQKGIPHNKILRVLFEEPTVLKETLVSLKTKSFSQGNIENRDQSAIFCYFRQEIHSYQTRHLNVIYSTAKQLVQLKLMNHNIPTSLVLDYFMAEPITKEERWIPHIRETPSRIDIEHALILYAENLSASTGKKPATKPQVITALETIIQQNPEDELQGTALILLTDVLLDCDEKNIISLKERAGLGPHSNADILHFIKDLKSLGRFAMTADIFKLIFDPTIDWSFKSSVVSELRYLAGMKLLDSIDTSHIRRLIKLRDLRYSEAKLPHFYYQCKEVILIILNCNEAINDRIFNLMILLHNKYEVTEFNRKTDYHASQALFSYLAKDLNKLEERLTFVEREISLLSDLIQYDKFTKAIKVLFNHCYQNKNVSLLPANKPDNATHFIEIASRSKDFLDLMECYAHLITPNNLKIFCLAYRAHYDMGTAQNYHRSMIQNIQCRNIDPTEDAKGNSWLKTCCEDEYRAAQHQPTPTFNPMNQSNRYLTSSPYTVWSRPATTETASFDSTSYSRQARYYG